MLLNRRFFEICSQGLDVSGDVQRLDLVQCTKLVMLTPSEEPAGRVQIGRPRVRPLCYTRFVPWSAQSAP
jgi:hypothetical protein